MTNPGGPSEPEPRPVGSPPPAPALEPARRTFDGAFIGPILPPPLPPATPALPPPPPPQFGYPSQPGWPQAFPAQPMGAPPPPTEATLAIPLDTRGLVKEALDLLTRSDSGLRGPSFYVGFMMLVTLAPLVVLFVLALVTQGEDLFGPAYGATGTDPTSAMARATRPCWPGCSWAPSPGCWATSPPRSRPAPSPPR